MKKYKSTYAPSRASMTVPHQGLTVEDILSRFTRGQSLPVGRVPHDDPQGMDEDEQMNLYECEDEFERRDVLLSIEEGIFNEPPKDSSRSRSVKQAKSPDSVLVEKPSDSVDNKKELESNS